MGPRGFSATLSETPEIDVALERSSFSNLMRNEAVKRFDSFVSFLDHVKEVDGDFSSVDFYVSF